MKKLILIFIALFAIIANAAECHADLKAKHCTDCENGDSDADCGTCAAGYHLAGTVCNTQCAENFHSTDGKTCVACAEGYTQKAGNTIDPKEECKKKCTGDELNSAPPVGTDCMCDDKQVTDKNDKWCFKAEDGSVSQKNIGSCKGGGVTMACKCKDVSVSIKENQFCNPANGNLLTLDAEDGKYKTCEVDAIVTGAGSGTVACQCGKKTLPAEGYFEDYCMKDGEELDIEGIDECAHGTFPDPAEMCWCGKIEGKKQPLLLATNQQCSVASNTDDSVVETFCKGFAKADCTTANQILMGDNTALDAKKCGGSECNAADCCKDSTCTTWDGIEANNCDAGNVIDATLNPETAAKEGCCTKCAENFHADKDGKCVACAAGKFLAAAATETECKDSSCKAWKGESEENKCDEGVVMNEALNPTVANKTECCKSADTDDAASGNSGMTQSVLIAGGIAAINLLAL